MVYISDPDCVWMVIWEYEFGNEEQLSLLNKKYSGNVEMNYQSGLNPRNIDYC